MDIWKNININYVIGLREYKLGSSHIILLTHCTKRVAPKTYLLRHQITHNGEKLFQWSHCAKHILLIRINNVSAYLICQIRTHTGEKPYQCIQCDKAFSLNSHLKSHMNDTLRKHYINEANMLRISQLILSLQVTCWHIVGRNYINTIKLTRVSHRILAYMSHDDTHRGEAISMQPMWQGFFHE